MNRSGYVASNNLLLNGCDDESKEIQRIVFMVLITALSLNLSVIPPPRNSLLLLLLF
jgi:hypothetical protein